jgi:hypothetical protein
MRRLSAHRAISPLNHPFTGVLFLVCSLLQDVLGHMTTSGPGFPVPVCVHSSTFGSIDFNGSLTDSFNNSLGYLASILTPNLLHGFPAACRVSPIANWLNSRIILVTLLRVLIESLHSILFRASFQCFIGLILSLGTRLVPSVSYFN